MTKSQFVGTAELLYSKKNNYNYLVMWYGTWPMLGFESKTSKLSFNFVQNFKKTLWQHLHDKKDPDSNPIPDLKNKRLIDCGNLKLKFTRKTGVRVLKGFIQNTPIIGYEDLRIRNKFHLTIDYDKLTELRNKVTKTPEKIEVITDENVNIPATAADEGINHELSLVS